MDPALEYEFSFRCVALLYVQNTGQQSTVYRQQLLVGGRRSAVGKAYKSATQGCFTVKLELGSKKIS